MNQFTNFFRGTQEIFVSLEHQNEQWMAKRGFFVQFMCWDSD